MSQTIIIPFDKDGNAMLNNEHVFQNAWRGAMAIWLYLLKKYHPQSDPYILMARITDANKLISELANNPNLEEWEKIVLHTTYDGALVRREELPRVAAAFMEFPETSSLKAQAVILDLLSKAENISAVGWDQNNICESGWRFADGRPYNYNEGNDHYFIFDEIDGQDYDSDKCE